MTQSSDLRPLDFVDWAKLNYLQGFFKSPILYKTEWIHTVSFKEFHFEYVAKAWSIYGPLHREGYRLVPGEYIEDFKIHSEIYRELRDVGRRERSDHDWRIDKFEIDDFKKEIRHNLWFKMPDGHYFDLNSFLSRLSVSSKYSGVSDGIHTVADLHEHFAYWGNSKPESPKSLPKRLQPRKVRASIYGKARQLLAFKRVMEKRGC